MTSQDHAPTAGDAHPRVRPETDSAPPLAMALAAETLGEVHRLRNLLTQLYVAVLGNLPVDGHVVEAIPAAAWEDLMTTVWDAAEGRPFKHLKLPWPPLTDGAPLRQDETDASPREAKLSEGMDT